MSRITVLLAEDHTIVREGLRILLSSESGIEVVDEAEDGHAAVALVRKLHPDIVVMDISMPLLNGLEATTQILKASPNTKVIILSAHSDDAYVQKAIAIGASGYLVKQSAAHILPEAIRQISAGKPYFSPHIAKRMADQIRKARANGAPSPIPGQLVKLTTREAEVLQLIAEGRSNKESASLLHISIKTVEKHRQSLMEKLNIHDTAGLTRHAVATGIIESSVRVKIL